MVQLPRNEKQTHGLKSRPQMWPSGLTLAMTLTFNFPGQIWNLLYLSQKWWDCHETKSKHNDWSQGFKCDYRVWPWPWIFKVKYGIGYISAKMVQFPRNEKQTHGLNSRPQMWPSDLILTVTLTLNFQGQMWNLLYLNQKWSDCHETKSKHIDWTLDLKSAQWLWTWPWPCYLNLQGHMWSWPFGVQGHVYWSTR